MKPYSRTRAAGIPHATLVLTAWLTFQGPVAMAGEARFKDCYATWSDTELTIGNTRIERKWSIRQGLLTPTSLRDKSVSREWLRAPGRQAAPSPGGSPAVEERTTSFTTRSGKLGPVEAESLVIEMESKGNLSSFKCRFQVFPEASGITIDFDPGISPPLQANAKDKETTRTPDGIEAPAAKPNKKPKDLDAIEDLMLDARHFRFTQVSLMDQTDRQNELVHEQDWLPLQDEFDLTGNLFSIEDPLTGDGLVFLKLAPLPHARTVKNPFDARVLGGNRRVLFTGHGYPSVLLEYTGGQAGRIAALQDFQRCLRTFDPDRDARFLSNTWGDRSADSRVNEAFMRKEIDAGSRIGVDVVEVDDGWQKGKSGNSAFGKGAWGRFHAADPEFWSAHPERFPHGLKPLVEAAAAKGMKFGLWFGPDSENGMANWERDADLLLTRWKDDGVPYMKIDAVDLTTPGSEQNLRNFYDKILRTSAGQVTFDADATAGLRTSYFGAPALGPVYVENRYTDWQNYHPHLTLRTLWKLAAHVDPLRLRMEFLNNHRNAALYKDDPLAPARYSPDALFATVMFSNPLGFFESSNLPAEYFEKLPPLVTAWKKEREAIFSGHIIPIGSAPDGAEWTGFASTAKDGQSARLVIFREFNDASSWSVKIPLLHPAKHSVTVLGGSGSATLNDGILTANIPEKLQYLFLRVE